MVLGHKPHGLVALDQHLEQEWGQQWHLEVAHKVVEKLYHGALDEVCAHDCSADFKCEDVVVCDSEIDLLPLDLHLVRSSSLLDLILADLRCLGEDAESLGDLLSLDGRDEPEVVSVESTGENGINFAVQEEVSEAILDDELLADLFSC